MTRAYPLPRSPQGEDDPRFTMGLLVDVIEVLKRHGYPSLDGIDAVELQLALFRFIYEKACVVGLVVLLLATACGGAAFESSSPDESPLAGAQSSAGARALDGSAGLSGGAVGVAQGNAAGNAGGELGGSSGAGGELPGGSSSSGAGGELGGSSGEPPACLQGWQGAACPKKVTHGAPLTEAVFTPSPPTTRKCTFGSGRPRVRRMRRSPPLRASRLGRPPLPGKHGEHSTVASAYFAHRSRREARRAHRSAERAEASLRPPP